MESLIVVCTFVAVPCTSIRFSDLHVSSQCRGHRGRVKREWGEVKAKAGLSVLDELLGFEKVRPSQEGVTVKTRVCLRSLTQTEKQL